MGEFNRSVMFDYNLKEKKRFAYGTFVILGLLAALILLYLLLFQNMNIPLIEGAKQVVIHIATQISDKTLLGIFYASSIGGLFFVTISLEAVFLTFLRSGYSGALLVGIYLAGLILSYTINYYLGMRLAGFSQKAISPKRFYKIKGILNKYGVGAIFFFNVLPLPSQPLSAILGVFRYNKAKFYTFFLLGQLVKYSIVVGAYLLIGV